MHAPVTPHRKLSDKIKNYYGYIVDREVHTDEADIIAGLSTSLRTQVRAAQLGSAKC